MPKRDREIKDSIKKAKSFKHELVGQWMMSLLGIWKGKMNRLGREELMSFLRV